MSDNSPTCKNCKYWVLGRSFSAVCVDGDVQFPEGKRKLIEVSKIGWCDKVFAEPIYEKEAPTNLIITDPPQTENQWGSGGVSLPRTGPDFGCIHFSAGKARFAGEPTQEKVIHPIALESPALRKRHPQQYRSDFNGRVPWKIRMLETVRPDIPWLLPPQDMGMLLIKGHTYECWVNSYGAVAGICDGGQKLGVKPDEFEVVEWHNASQMA